MMAHIVLGASSAKIKCFNIEMQVWTKKRSVLLFPTEVPNILFELTYYNKRFLLMNYFILKCNFEAFSVVLKNSNFSMSIFKTLHRIHQWLLGKSQKHSRGPFRRNGRTIPKKRQASEIVK